MSAPPRPVMETRRDQMFPILEEAEIERLGRFGEVRSFAAGESLLKLGETGHGMTLILSGEVAIAQQDQLGRRQDIITHHRGSFIGEVAQLSGGPALVDAVAQGPAEALIIPPERLRALLIAEAELGERIMRALILRRVGLLETKASGPIILGHADDGDVLRLENFLGRNGHPHQLLDPDTNAEAKALLDSFDVTPADMPVVVCPGGRMLRNPPEIELARCIGLVLPIDPKKVYDLVIIGAGPAGLAAAVYAGSEGLSVLVLDCRAFGGQAGASMRIENYLGFPTGITGMALMGRSYNQARKFGVEMAIPQHAVRLQCVGGGKRPLVLTLGSDERAQARAVVIASGARYRQLEVEGIDAFEASSVHYWASPLEAQLCSTQEVALVGAGNSAGQAIVYLAGHAKKVWVLIRGKSLDASMSRYLVDRIGGLSNVEVVTESTITGLEGKDGNLERIRWRRAGSDEEKRCPIRHLFLFIGAGPNTDWLAGSGVRLDDKGFVRTGLDAGAGCRPLETSRQGVFAIGDVRSGSIKRVAAAVGEGAQVVAALHAFLADAVRSAAVAGSGS